MKNNKELESSHLTEAFNLELKLHSEKEINREKEKSNYRIERRH